MKKVVLLALIWVFLSLAISGHVVFADELYFKIITDNNEYIYYYPEIYLREGEYKLNAKELKIERICADSYVFAINAGVELSDNKSDRFKITPEKKGRVVDGEMLSLQIDSALNKGERTVHAIYRDIYPEMDSAYIKRCLNLKSSFSTDYGQSGEERKHNIKLAADKINKRILFSNEEFSFNGCVGRRNEENGYKTAKTIENGVFVDGVGGGVCQVSTTVYNAVLLAGLKITEYHPHSLAVGYVEKSFDAMVTDLWADLRFVNDTSGLLFLFAEANGQRLTVWIYGTENEYTYERESVIVEEIPPEISVSKVDGLLSGEKVVKVKGKSGFKSRGYLKAYKGEVLLRSELIRSDEYKKIDEIILEGA